MSAKKHAQYTFHAELPEIRELIDNKNYAQALRELNMLLDFDPENHEARFFRALAYQKRNDFEKAVRDYELLLEKNPKHEKARYNVAMIFAFQLRDSEKALQHFDAFLSLHPEHEKIPSIVELMNSLGHASQEAKEYFTQGDMLGMKENIEEAIICYQQALKIQPTSAPGYLKLGRLLKKVRRHEEAKIAFRKAMLFSNHYPKSMVPGEIQ